jgi:hypothetical protein
MVLEIDAAEEAGNQIQRLPQYMGSFSEGGESCC